MLYNFFFRFAVDIGYFSHELVLISKIITELICEAQRSVTIKKNSAPVSR